MAIRAYISGPSPPRFDRLGNLSPFWAFYYFLGFLLLGYSKSKLQMSKPTQRELTLGYDMASVAHDHPCPNGEGELRRALFLYSL